MSQLHKFCSHGYVIRISSWNLQPYIGVPGTLLFILKLLFWAFSNNPRIFASPIWNEQHLEEQEDVKKLQDVDSKILKVLDQLRF